VAHEVLRDLPYLSNHEDPENPENEEFRVSFGRGTVMVEYYEKYEADTHAPQD